MRWQRAEGVIDGRLAANARRVDIAFVVLVTALFIVMVKWANYETVPYHLIFLSLAIVYGFRVWSGGATFLVLAVIATGTGGVLFSRYLSGEINLEELSEIVLMPLILAATAWHARRRVAMQRQVEMYAETERERWLREQEFLRDCSHALRTPLTIARGHVELLGAMAGPDCAPDVAVVLGELDRLNRLASRLLAIADLERSDSLHLRPVDLGWLVRMAKTRWAASVDRDWILDVVEPAWSNIDKERLETALDAIVENAVKATGPGDTIRLVCLGGRRAQVAVADSGPGIASQDRDKVFERFWRGPAVGLERGTGLGLAFARSVAEAHGGGVFVEPAPEGGALVGLWLNVLPMPQTLPGPVVAAGERTA